MLGIPPHRLRLFRGQDEYVDSGANHGASGRPSTSLRLVPLPATRERSPDCEVGASVLDQTQQRAVGVDEGGDAAAPGFAFGRMEAGPARGGFGQAGGAANGVEGIEIVDA